MSRSHGIPSSRLHLALLITVGLCVGASRADTLTLKNGSLIDGMVTGRHEGYIILTIGNLGVVKIAETEVVKIERNTRTGYLDPDRRVKKTKKLPQVEVGKGKPSERRPGEGEAPGEDEKARPPRPSSEVGGKVELDPELLREIQSLAEDLTKQRTTKRTRAERKLLRIGDAAIPELIGLAHHPFVRTRAAVLRIFKRSKDWRVVKPCLDGLADSDPFVRKLAWEGLRHATGRRFGFPWESESVAKRERALRRWAAYVEAENERRRAAEAAKAAAAEGAAQRPRSS